MGEVSDAGDRRRARRLARQGFPFPRADSHQITQDDFPAIISAIAADNDEQFGAGADGPWREGSVPPPAEAPGLAALAAAGGAGSRARFRAAYGAARRITILPSDLVVKYIPPGYEPGDDWSALMEIERRGSRSGSSAGAVVLLSALLFTPGCSQPPSPQVEVVRPVKTMIVRRQRDARAVAPGHGRSIAASRAGVSSARPAGQAAGQGRPEGRQGRGDRPAPAGRIPGPARRRCKASSIRRARLLAALRAGERPEERLRRESQVRAAEARLANAQHRSRSLRRAAASKAHDLAAGVRARSKPPIAWRRKTTRRPSAARKGHDRPRGRHRRQGGRSPRARRPRRRSQYPARRTRRSAPPTTA